ncbi:hypothetical protein [Calothrix sp. UHCC 0171]|uniref:hypothetical protein n=1 Tax=Calothrix sp. UHCC 0171 TaxID=3110245 RepID=UPI002B20871F|nr:hypothetical protein [Calothrix sp. UHCC 0171]MEA5572860.1 hypothetical protein [Calothrix sp. UHCC 0171]
MFNKKFLTLSIAGIAAVATILATASRVQAEQSLTTNKVNPEYRVAQVYRQPGNDRYPGNGRYPDPYRPNPWNNRRALAEVWERARMRRYRECMVRSHHNWRFCDRILRERNPYEGYRWN